MEKYIGKAICIRPDTFGGVTEGEIVDIYESKIEDCPYYIVCNKFSKRYLLQNLSCENEQPLYMSYTLKMKELLGLK